MFRPRLHDFDGRRARRNRIGGPTGMGEVPRTRSEGGKRRRLGNGQSTVARGGRYPRDDRAVGRPEVVDRAEQYKVLLGP